MEKDRNQRSETILNLTLEIICLLTGEDCVIVTKTSGENVTSSSHQLSGGWNRTQSSNMEPQSLIHERNNDLKILELTNKIIQLLTGENADNVEGLKDTIKENPQPLVSDCTSEGSNIEINIWATKYEDIMDTDHPQIQSSYTSIKEESCDTENVIDPDIKTPTNHAQMEYMLCPFNEECASKYEFFAEPDVTAPTDYTQPQSTDIKVTSEEQSLRDTDNCTSSGHTNVTYTNVYIKEELDTRGVENVTDTEYPTLSVETQYSPSRIDQIHQAQEKPFLCSVCGKRFKRKPGFVNHQKRHTGENMYYCSVCGKTFISKSYFTNHQKLHSEDKPYSCVECGKCFITKTHLVTHHRVHTGEKPYSCSECGKTFSIKSNLVGHQKFHIGDRPFFCTECGKSFVVKRNLLSHQQIHTKEKIYSCSECGKNFICKSYLTKHRKLHSEDKPYSCVECGKCFLSNSHLVIHHKVHTGERPYSCSECGKTFITKSNLVGHQKFHIGDKPYCCTECGKSFVVKRNLVSHQRIHTREKTYSCSECGKCFFSEKYLNRHSTIHTKEKP